MGKIIWDFPLLGNGNKSGSNIAAIQMFQGTGSGVMDGLAREVCQNSLDAKLETLPEEAPVIVKFSLIEVEKAKYPDLFQGYEEALENARDYWENNPLKTNEIMTFIDSMQSSLDNELIPIMVMSDHNTFGLRGVNLDPDLYKSFWDLMVNTDGISIKQNENSAGSYGIGKNAPFAYSAFNMVFYNTLADDGGRAFEGVARLLTTQVETNGRKCKTQPIGKYLYLEEDGSGRPIYPEDGCDIANIEAFRREDGDFGTDVAVVGFKTDDEENWEKSTAIAFIKNFILAIKNGKLEITFKTPNAFYEINKETLHDLLYSEFKNEPALKYTRQIYETITEPDKINNVRIAEDGDLSIFVKYKDSYSQSVSRFRSTGMLINTTTGDSLPHFSIVLIANDVGEKKLSKTLRASEPPQHTEWKAKHVKNDKTTKNRASRYISAISRAVQTVMDEYDSSEIETSMDAGVGGFLPDTSDQLDGSNGSSGLRTDIKVSEIVTNEGLVLFSKEYHQGESSEGSKLKSMAVRTGTKRHKKRIKKKIVVVDPESGTTKGVSDGSGKIRFVKPVINDERTFYLGLDRYRTYVDSPEDYERVYIDYRVGRDYDGEDDLIVKSIKIKDQPIMQVNSSRVGPIQLKKGQNLLYVQFEDNGKLAVTPVFSMEVIDEKQSN